MKYTAFEFTWYDQKGRRRTLRIGRSFVYATVSAIALLTGHHFLSGHEVGSVLTHLRLTGRA